MFSRTISLLGEENFSKLQNAKVCVVGVGGVGGAVCEVLARTGVENLLLIDGDVVGVSNLNRQIFTTQENIGKPKVEEMKKRILAINPNAKIETIFRFLTPENIAETLLGKYDYVIDCIDDIKAKVALICFSKACGINVISAMGAGNRSGLPNFEVMDIFKTSYDPLAKVLRKKLREENIEALDVCISNTEADKKLSPPASVMWQPLTAGAVIASFVINKICKT